MKIVSQSSTGLQYLLLLIVWVTSYGCSAAPQGGVSSAQILKDLQKGKDAVYQGKVIEGALDFTALSGSHREGVQVDRIYVDAALVFVNCTFKGKITAYKGGTDQKDRYVFTHFSKGVTFVECRFEEEVSFREADFAADVTFFKSDFIKNVSFEGARFQGKSTQFRETNFSESAKFQRMDVLGSFDALKATFLKSVSFQQARFRGDAQLGAIQCHGYVDFSTLRAEGNFLAQYAIFKERIAAVQAQFRGRCEFMSAEFHKESDFSEAVFLLGFSLRDAKLMRNIQMQKCVFLSLKSDLEGTQFLNESKILLDSTEG